MTTDQKLTLILEKVQPFLVAYDAALTSLRLGAVGAVITGEDTNGHLQQETISVYQFKALAEAVRSE